MKKENKVVKYREIQMLQSTESGLRSSGRYVSLSKLKDREKERVREKYTHSWSTYHAQAIKLDYPEGDPSGLCNERESEKKRGRMSENGALPCGLGVGSKSFTLSFLFSVNKCHLFSKLLLLLCPQSSLYRYTIYYTKYLLYSFILQM